MPSSVITLRLSCLILKDFAWGRISCFLQPYTRGSHSLLGGDCCSNEGGWTRAISHFVGPNVVLVWKHTAFILEGCHKGFFSESEVDGIQRILLLHSSSRFQQIHPRPLTYVQFVRYFRND